MGSTVRYIMCLLFYPVCVLLPTGAIAQHEAGIHGALHEAVPESSEHQGHHAASSGWEGSAEGIAYSEQNHHIAGLLVLLMGLAELSHALRSSSFSWTRYLLPAAMTGTGVFLIVWSDHEAWPIGSLSFSQSFFGPDPEIVQHKLYGLLALAVGAIEFIRRLGSTGHAAWTTPLPLMAIIGGLMLFGHSHGYHPSAQKITLHHAVMGAMALTAGSSKLVGGWLGRSNHSASRWEILWAVLILVIGAQLLIYSE